MKYLLVVLPLLLSLSCSTSPTGRRQLTAIPDEQMDSMGEQAFADLKSSKAVEKSRTVNQYVDCVSQRILNSLDTNQNWEVVVFEDKSPNAFALPGGKIGINTGLLSVAKNQHQLATVIGHEIAHVIAEHGNERASQQLAAQGGMALLGSILQEKDSSNYQLIMAALGIGAQFGVLMPYGRRQESEADVLGIDYMAKAGFDPRESVKLWENMAAAAGGSQPPEFLSTHPSHGSRIGELQNHMDEAMNYYSESKKAECSEVSR